VFYKAMRVKFIGFYFITIVFTLLFMYYIMAFCAVYSTIAIAWISSSITNVILSWSFFQFLGPVSGALVRSIVKSNPKHVY
jgi:hypothetical protein